MLVYLIALIGYLILFFIVRHLYVPNDENKHRNSWNIKYEDYNVRLKLPLWIYILYFIGFLIPYFNIVLVYSTIFVLILTIILNEWCRFKIESKFLNFLNKKF